MGKGLLAAVLAAAGALLPCAAPAPAADAVPRDGLDAVVLADGRVVLCRCRKSAEGTVELGFEGGSVQVPRAAVAEIRLFADYDPEPRTDEERKSAAAGLVRWGGRWIEAKARDAAIGADRARERKLRAEAGAPADWADRSIRNTGHFVLEANLRKKDVDAYQELLEGFYGYFTSGLKVSVKNRIPVYVFRTREEFQEFQKKDTGHVSEHAVGYFMPIVGREHLALFDWQGDREETLGVLFHESTHLFMHLANPEIDLPNMINEGIAEYYGAATYRKGKFTRGRVQDGRLADVLRMLDEKTLPSLEQLLARGHPDRDAPDWAAFTVDDYAQSWAFVHFLFHAEDGKYLPRLLTYLNAHWSLKLKDADPDGTKERRWMRFSDDRALLLRTLKAKDFASLDRDFVAYVKGLKFGDASGRVTRAFHLLRKGQDREGAAAELRAALAAAGDDVEILGKIVKGFSLIEGCEQEASAVLDRVVALDPLNMPLRYELTAWFPDDSTEIPHLRICAAFDPLDVVGLNSRAWLSFRGIHPANLLAAGLGEPEDLDAERKAILAGEKPTAAGLLRAAEISLRIGEPGPAREAARRAAAADPSSPAPQALLARAAAAEGDARAFTASLGDFRRAAIQRAAAESRPASAPEMETLGAFMDAVAYALALEKVAEARRAVDAWFAAPGFRARTEGEWVLFAGLALKGGDFQEGIQRLRKGLAAAPGAGRLGWIVWFIPPEALPPDLRGGPDE